MSNPRQTPTRTTNARDAVAVMVRVAMNRVVNSHVAKAAVMVAKKVVVAVVVAAKAEVMAVVLVVAEVVAVSARLRARANVSMPRANPSWRMLAQTSCRHR